MLSFIWNYLLKPVLLYLGLLIPAALISGQFEFVAIFYMVAGFSLIVTWWGTVFSRWLYQRFGQRIIGYLVSNLVWGAGIVLFSLSLGVTLTNGDSSIGVFVFLAGLLGGLIWIGRSLYCLMFTPARWDTTVHAWPLILPWEQPFQALKAMYRGSLHPAEQFSFANTGTSAMPKKKKHRKEQDKPKKSLFQTIMPGRSDESGGMAIPPRREQSARVGDFFPAQNVSFSYEDHHERFLKEARQYVDKTGNKAEPVPFMHYWPTYSNMSSSQQRWYFYWRTQLRQGNWLPADTSYLFVHIYEALNVIGFETPREASKHLFEFWRHYRELQPKLDNYLPDWIADFLVVHQLPMDPLRWYGTVAKVGVQGHKDLIVEGWVQAGGNFADLSNELLFRLADYNPTRNKFYKQYSEEADLDTAYKKGLQAVNTYLQAETGKSLFQHFQKSRSYAVHRMPFASALHGYSRSHIKIAEAHEWFDNQKLSNALKGIIKYTENVLREQHDYGYKLRGIKLKDAWKTVIDETLAEPVPERELRIDLGAVERLEDESLEVRERLLAEENGTSEDGAAQIDITVEPPVADDDTAPAESAAAQAGPALNIDLSQVDELEQEQNSLRERLTADTDIPAGRPEPAATADGNPDITRPDDAPDGLLTDLPAVMQIIQRDEDIDTVLRVLMAADWQATTEHIQQALDGGFANVVIDRINERAFDAVGDALLFDEDSAWIVTEEYRDEIEYILTHPEYVQAQEPDTSTGAWDNLDDEWRDFASALEPYHWDAIAAILSNQDVESRLYAIATTQHLTGNLLIDEINDAAYETIGDILIEAGQTPVVVEEYRETITSLLNQAANQGILEV